MNGGRNAEAGRIAPYPAGLFKIDQATVTGTSVEVRMAWL